MAQPKPLERFEFEETDEGYLLTVAGAGGGRLRSKSHPTRWTPSSTP